MVSDAIDLSVRGVAAHFAKYGKIVDIELDEDGNGYMDFKLPAQTEAALKGGIVRSRHCINGVLVYCKVCVYM